MGFLTMPQLVLAAAIGGSGPDRRPLRRRQLGLRRRARTAASKCPESVRRQAVNRLLNG